MQVSFRKEVPFMYLLYSCCFCPMIHGEGNLCSKLNIGENDFDSFELDDLVDWLKNQQRQVVTFCNNNPVDENESNVDLPSFSFLEKADNCANSQTYWTGKLDQKGLPKGPGHLKWRSGAKIQDDNNVIGQGINECCLNLKTGIHSFSGSFSKDGILKGKGKIEFENDLHGMEGQLVDGLFDGKVTQQDRNKKLNFVGIYKRGLAHGPAWIFPEDPGQQGRIFIWFEQGEVVPYPTVWLSKNNRFYMGTLANSSLLLDAKEVKFSRSTDYRCVQVLDTTTAEPVKKSKTSPKKIRLPVVIKALPELGKVVVRSGKTLIFNRIAKTGSQSIAELLVQLEKKNQIKPHIIIKQVENLLEDPRSVSGFVEEIDRKSEAGAWIRHYNFFNMMDYGALWNPIYINMVRDPVERVISFFYYRRAAWNIVERKLAFPNDPLPDPDFLRKDYDSCVLSGDPECSYEEGSNIMKYDDHRSQIMAFCGHDWMCTEFNSKDALERAKANVDQFYSVVGVVERMNDTLTVLEHELPMVFSGAKKLYNSNREIKRKQMKNAYKLPVSDQVMDLVRQNFTREIEFYEFCQQRLQHQLESFRK
ncbi:hypothetical protein TCAL_00102 [Tigriopus californicus]|uniref:Sulfotransferase domain-containing protein n=1 Tax=Tigriopus californicus TaxID=6832 RepID=A0A553PHY2_TIGCA|nr:uncharacterized protein LOC131880902 [Tigriopus californicus]TRY77290.1 hypothetical protein TCAL_00102 [Tigriopus californicus]